MERRLGRYKAYHPIIRRQNFIICCKASGQNLKIWEDYLNSRSLRRRDWKKDIVTERINGLGILIVYGYLRDEGGKDMAIVLKDMIKKYWIPPTSYYCIYEKKYNKRSKKPWKRYDPTPQWNFEAILD